MERCEQLQSLEKEHNDALVFADQVLDIANSGDVKALEEGISLIKSYYNNELEVHFQHEERTIFAPLFKVHRQHIQMATALLKEHGFIRLLIQRIDLSSAQKDLTDFALTLKNHTIVEEEELFPIIETLFTAEELEAIVNFEPVDM